MVFKCKMCGGTLEFKMGDRPSRWGTAPNARPE